MFHFLEIPLPRISSGREFDAIVRKVAQLVCTTDEFSELKKETGVEHALTGEADRNLVRVQLDAMVANLYGITKKDMEFILQQFPIVDQRQKELVLEQF